MDKEKRYLFGYDEYECVRSVYDSKSDIEFEETDLRDIVDILNQQDQTISDLEAKLAESEEKIKELEEKIVFEKSNAFELGERAIMSTLKENNQLKQQLAEKEKQIETQKSNIEFLYDLFVSPNGEQTLKAINQDKISFAVEQLEKVKTLCKENFDWWENNGFKDSIYDKLDVSNAYFHIEAIIEEQIKHLTHQHEDKGE